jgi:hypothetical protein
MQIINDLTTQANGRAQTKQNTSQNGEQSRSTRSRQRLSNKDIILESLKKELTDHIDKQLALVPKRCAEVRSHSFYKHESITLSVMNNYGTTCFAGSPKNAK